MGAGVSRALGPEVEGGGPHEVGLGDLPESCVAEVMIRLDPAEICRLARLSRAFRGAAAADFVWVTKLPENYRYLIEKALGESDSKRLGFLTKKEIYAQLCRRNLFDEGTKEFWMEKKMGGICMWISSKALAITGIDDRRYWNYIPTEESSWELHADQIIHSKRLDCQIIEMKKRFHTVAYLQQVWWLEVAGELDFCFPPGTYSLYFRLHLGRASKWLGRRICCLDHVHGWDIKPVKFQLRTSDGQHAVSECHLGEPGNWNRYHVGDFVVEKSNVQAKVKFSMTQIDCTHTKGGLCVDSVLIYPKGYRQVKTL